MSRPFSLTVLSPAPTWPLNYGNRKRIHQVCQRLKDDGARIDFILYALEDDWRRSFPRDALETMREQWDDVHLIVPSVPYHPAARGADHEIDEWWDPAVGSFLEWYFRGQRPDAMLVNYPYLSKALEYAPDSCLRILDTHDRFGGRRELLAELGLEAEFFHTTTEEEGKALARSDLALAIKDEEADYFRSISRTPVLTLPHIDAPSTWVHEPDPEGYLRVGLLGARNNVNVSNTQRFLDVALPRFEGEMAPVRIVLGGSMCEDLSAYASHPLVSATGTLPDVRSFYERIDVALVPIERSSGQKIRVGEALSLGMPVMTHRHSFEGYEPWHPYHQLESMEAIADACIELSFDPAGLADLVVGSRRSHDLTERKAQRAGAVIADLARTHAPTSVFLVSAEALSAAPELRLHLLAVVSLAASYSRVRLLLTGTRVNAELERLVSLLRGSAQVLDMTAEGQAGAANDLNIERVIDAPETRDVWCYDDAWHLVSGKAVNVVLYSGFAPSVRGSHITEPFGVAVRGRVAIGRVTERDGEYVFEPWRVIPLAATNDQTVRLLPELLGVERSDAGMVIARTPTDPLAAIILANLQAQRIETKLVLLEGPEGDRSEWLRRDRVDRAWSLEVMDAAAARAWARESAARLVFDCSHSHPQAEALLLIAELHADRGVGGPPWTVPRAGSQANLLDVTRSVLGYIQGDRGADPPRRSKRTGATHFFNQRSLDFISSPIAV